MIEDHILDELKAQTAADYEVLGPLSATNTRLCVLARERASGDLVVFRLDQEGDEDEFDLHIIREIDSTVGSEHTLCPRCGREGVSWIGTCASCGAKLGARDSTLQSLSDKELLETVRDAATVEGDVVGMIRREPSGAPVFFARKGLGALRGFALWADEDVEDDEFHLVPIWGEPRSVDPSFPSSNPQPDSAATPRHPAAPPSTHKRSPAPKQPPVASSPRGGASSVGSSSGAAAGPTTPSGPSSQAPNPPSSTPWYDDQPEGEQGSRKGWVIGAAAVGIVAIGVLLLDPFGGGSPAVDPEPPTDVVQTAPNEADDLGAAATGLAADSSVADGPTDGEDAPTTVAETPPPQRQATPSEQPTSRPTPRLGTVSVLGSFPDGTRISVNGRAIDGTTVQETPGRYTLAISAPGYFPTTAEFEIEAGITKRWSPTLRRLTTETESPPQRDQPQAETPPVRSDPPVSQPEAAPADPTSAILQSLETYRSALESHDMAQLRDAFFGIPPSEEERWEPFFAQFNEGRFSNLSVGLDAAPPEITPDGERAEVAFSLTLSYVDPNGSPPGRPIPLRAVLRGGSQGWLLIRIDPGD